MYVVIAGGGVFGQGLASRLVEDRHDVVVIDSDRAVCEDVSSTVGALAIHGSATQIDVLTEAGIDKADVAVGALPTDADNLAFSLLARDANVPRLVARMNNPQYESVYRLAGVTRAFNLSELFVQHIALEIEQPDIRQVATFGKGQASIVVIAIPEDALVDGKTVQQIAKDDAFPNECVIAGIFRQEEGEFVFPRGGATIHSGDQIFLASHADIVRKASQYLRRTK